MSFRELRSFTETMRALGYPRLISMENFRLPNFELVADCLYWLVHRYYPGVDISDEISTEADRVKFLQSVAQAMLTKARMKLNIKKLYAADGNAVKELLKVATLLYQATLKAQDMSSEDTTDPVDFTAALKGFNTKDIKQYAAEILKAGGTLYDVLGQEAELRDARARAVAGHMDTEFIQQSIQEAISQTEDSIKSLEFQLEELERNEKTLDSKIEKKKQELERNEKRLGTLQSVRPAYMDEYERLQAELNMLYGAYLERFRNLEYLESELEAYYQAEQEKMEAQERRLKKMQKRLAQTELRILRGEQEVDETAMNDSDDNMDDLSDDEDQAPRASGKRPIDGPAITPARGGAAAMAGAAAAGAAGGAVIGSLNDFDDDDEASIDEDDNTDGGEVSVAGEDDDEGTMGDGNAFRGKGFGGGMDYDNGDMDMADDDDDMIARDEEEDDDDEDDNDF